jgi:hypothetical protein
MIFDDAHYCVTITTRTDLTALRPDQPLAYMVIATLPWHIKGPASR